MNTTCRYRLKHLAVIRVTGEQANAFLQGQVSTDVRELTGMRAQISTINSVRGRVLAIPQLVRYGADVLLIVPSPIAENVVETLSKYILRTKVSLAVDPDLACMAIVGHDTNPAMEKLIGASFQRDWACASRDDLVAWQVPGEGPRIMIVGRTADIDATFNSLAEYSKEEVLQWRLQDILAKLPEILPATQDKFVPQMLALDSLGALNFDKGCYTGQEIIARARYLGKVKRLPAVGATVGRRPLKPGEVLRVEGNPAALVVSAAPHPDGGQALLAVINGEFPQGTNFKSDDGMEVLLQVRGDPTTIHSMTIRLS